MTDPVRARVRELVKLHKGVRPAAEALGIDNGYLSKLHSDKKRRPSNAIRAKLGLPPREQCQDDEPPKVKALTHAETDRYLRRWPIPSIDVPEWRKRCDWAAETVGRLRS